MKHYALRKVELNHVTPGLKRAAKDTLRIFRDAVTMLCRIALAEWGNWKDLNSSRQLTYLEELVHSTRLRGQIPGIRPAVLQVPFLLPQERHPCCLRAGGFLLHPFIPVSRKTGCSGFERAAF